MSLIFFYFKSAHILIFSIAVTCHKGSLVPAKWCDQEDASDNFQTQSFWTSHCKRCLKKRWTLPRVQFTYKIEEINASRPQNVLINVGFRSDLSELVAEVRTFAKRRSLWGESSVTALPPCAVTAVVPSASLDAHWTADGALTLKVLLTQTQTRRKIETGRLQHIGALS